MPLLFVAICLPKEARNSLGSLQSGLAKVRWVPNESLHLTVRFIGEVSRLDAEDIVVALKQIRTSPFEVRFGELGSFSSGSRVRSLWIGLGETSNLESLKRSVDRRLKGAGVEPDSRKYIPHVTLGRVGSRLSNLNQFFSWAGLVSHPTVKVDQYVLFSSRLSKSGPKYIPVQTYSLAYPGSTSGVLQNCQVS